MSDKFDEIENLLVGVQEHNGYISALCPFHEDQKPSLLVWKSDPPFFRCMGCNEQGSLGKLLRQLQGWEAPKIVSGDKSHTHILPSDIDELETLCYSAHTMLMANYDPLANYLINRGVENCIKPCNLGYVSGLYTIPIYDDKHNFIGAVGRTSPAKQIEIGLRFDTPTGQGALLYVPDWKLVSNSDYLVVVFGMFDALALTATGLPACTATAGKESTTPVMLEQFRKPIYVIPDKGEEKTGMNLVNRLGWRGRLITVTYPDGCKDPANLVQKGLTEIIIDGINRVKEILK